MLLAGLSMRWQRQKTIYYSTVFKFILCKGSSRYVHAHTQLLTVYSCSLNMLQCANEQRENEEKEYEKKKKRNKDEKKRKFVITIGQWDSCIGLKHVSSTAFSHKFESINLSADQGKIIVHPNSFSWKILYSVKVYLGYLHSSHIVVYDGIWCASICISLRWRIFRAAHNSSFVTDFIYRILVLVNYLRSAWKCSIIIQEINASVIRLYNIIQELCALK